MKTLMPEVSVVIPTYQHARYIGQALNSVLAQTYHSLEIIVVNDGSTDGTLQVLDSFGDRIKVVSYLNNKGLSAARNIGISNSRGRYIAFLDADDVWMPDKLEKQIPLLEKDNTIGLVYSDLLYFDEHGDLPASAFEQIPPHSGMVHYDLFKCDFIPMPTVIIRSACFDKVGLFDEARTACEDHDMWLRISQFWAVELVHEPLARYRFSPGQMHKNTERILANMLSVQEKAFRSSPDLQKMDIITLDRCYYDLYLKLARFYIHQNQGVKARDLLSSYIKVRGFTSRSIFLWTTSLIPRFLLNGLFKVRALTRLKNKLDDPI